MLNTKQLLRSLVAAGAIGALALAPAAPAFADPAPVTGVVAHAPHTSADSYLQGSVAGKPAGDHPVGVLGITIGTAPQQLIYCIDIGHGLYNNGTYVESTWAKAAHIPAGNLDKINWILHNSYPVKTVAEVAAAADAAAGARSAAVVTPPDYVVYAATQAAIWHYSDDFKLTGNGKDHAKFSDADFALVNKYYNYLVGVGAKTPATHSIAITPPNGTGPVGSKVGPYTVASTVGEVTLTVTGGKIVDADGKPVTKLADGGKFWLTSDVLGTASVTASGVGITELARVFVQQDKPDTYQKVIIPGTKREEVSAKATGTFTNVPASPSPSPGKSPEASPSPSASVAPVTPSASTPPLPTTGSSLTYVIGGGAALLAAGGGALLLVRRRRIAPTFEA